MAAGSNPHVVVPVALGTLIVYIIVQSDSNYPSNSTPSPIPGPSPDNDNFPPAEKEKAPEPGGSGARSGKNGGYNKGRNFNDTLKSNVKTFREYVKSFEKRAASSYGKDIPTAEKAEAILKRAIELNYRLGTQGVETDWVGGRHINLIGPVGNKIHFPLPPGINPYKL